MSYEELIADEDYTEEEARRIILQDKIDNLNEIIEQYEWMTKELKNEIEKDIKINKRCFVEKPDHYVERTLKLWSDYDKNLLEIINDYKKEIKEYKK